MVGGNGAVGKILPFDGKVRARIVGKRKRRRQLQIRGGWTGDFRREHDGENKRGDNRNSECQRFKFLVSYHINRLAGLYFLRMTDAKLKITVRKMARTVLVGMALK